MQEKFTELVVSGSFALVKGFLLGFKGGSETDFCYFFHRKSGIRRDTLVELLKEVLDLDNYVHLCLEDKVVQQSVVFILEVIYEVDFLGLEPVGTHFAGATFG